MGSLRFAIFYLTCGFVAAMTDLMTQWESTVPTVGASGAIAGAAAYTQAALGRIPPISLSRQLGGPTFALTKKKLVQCLIHREPGF
jgi:membrane associated rhomboid family serine protease